MPDDPDAPPPPDRSRRRTAARWGVVWFLISTLLLVAPIFTTYGNRVHPRVLGLPFALVYVLAVVALNFAVLVALFVTRAIDEGDD
jgi:heme/copper-type cytochrome/quinol oxidase subunit 3